MSELKWTDQDMINFAGRFSEYEVCSERYQACRSGKKASLNFRFCQNITDTKTTLN